VYIIESPSAVDIYHGRSEGALLRQAVGLDRIPCVVRTAISAEAFIAALRLGLPEAMKQNPERVPILHVSAHGSQEGIQLSNGEVIRWDQLRHLLMPLNKGLSGYLLLCMSACEGYSACRMAMQTENNEHPYFGIVANSGKPTWSDTAVAYATFYHLMAKGVPIPQVVEAMRLATADALWGADTAETIQRAFADAVAQLYLPAAQESIEAAAADTEVPPGAKTLVEARSDDASRVS
jgi:hypothetical protein